MLLQKDKVYPQRTRSPQKASTVASQSNNREAHLVQKIAGLKQQINTLKQQVNSQQATISSKLRKSGNEVPDDGDQIESDNIRAHQIMLESINTPTGEPLDIADKTAGVKL